MTTTAADAVIAGRDAWQRLCRRDRASWNDWLAVGHALLIGRAACMQIAKANKPVGSRYNAAVGNWLRENGLDGISNQERCRAPSSASKTSKPSKAGAPASTMHSAAG